MDDTALMEAAQLLLDATGTGDAFAQFVRDPVTGEKGLVVAVKGDAVGAVLQAVQPRRANLALRLARSFASDE